MMSHIRIRRGSIAVASEARERSFGHSDARDRACILLEIQEALDARVMSRAEGCVAAGVRDEAPFDGSLSTPALREVLAAILRVPR